MRVATDAIVAEQRAAGVVQRDFRAHAARTRVAALRKETNVGIDARADMGERERAMDAAFARHLAGVVEHQVSVRANVCLYRPSLQFACVHA